MTDDIVDLATIHHLAAPERYATALDVLHAVEDRWRAVLRLATDTRSTLPDGNALGEGTLWALLGHEYADTGEVIVTIDRWRKWYANWRGSRRLAYLPRPKYWAAGVVTGNGRLVVSNSGSHVPLLHALAPDGAFSRTADPVILRRGNRYACEPCGLAWDLDHGELLATRDTAPVHCPHLCTGTVRTA